MSQFLSVFPFQQSLSNDRQDPFKLPSSRTKSIILLASLFLHSLCFSNTGLVFIPRIHYLHLPQSLRSPLRHDQLRESSLAILFKTVIIMSCCCLFPTIHHLHTLSFCLLYPSTGVWFLRGCFIFLSHHCIHSPEQYLAHQRHLVFVGRKSNPTFAFRASKVVNKKKEEAAKGLCGCQGPI